MNISKRRFRLACLVLLAVGFLAAPGAPASAQGPVLVGRLAFVEGQILRYVPDSKDWVATIKDAPFGLSDAVYSDQSARAEFIMPNGVWARIGGSTQLQLIALSGDAGELDVAAGVARFYNKSSGAVLKVTTPFGYVLADPGGSFDLYVGDQSAEVIALGPGVNFISLADARIEVDPGSGSIIADATQVGMGDGTVDAAWDEWNDSRERLWTKRQVKGESVSYIPPQLQDDAYSLEENGQWEKVQYEGETRRLWRPTRVGTSWRPFTNGRWTEYYGDQCWVPDEDFGYVTHHYGNWVMVNNLWYWSPPPPPPPVAVVATPVISFGWNPGRVAWISSGAEVGWVPLAPTEVYYSHHHWGGPSAVVVGAAPAVAVSVGTLAFASAAVVVPQASFYSVRSYSTVQVTNINKTVIVNKFHAAPVVSDKVIPNYSKIQNRHNFTDVAVTRKPHQEVLKRVQHNDAVAAKEAKAINAQALKKSAVAAKPLTPAPKAAVPAPKVTNKIVPANQVSAPKNQVNFKPADIKTNPKPAQVKPGVARPGTQPQKPGTTAAPGTQPQKPGTTAAPGTQPQKPGTTAAPGAQPLKPGPGAVQPPGKTPAAGPGPATGPAGPTGPRGIQSPAVKPGTGPTAPTGPTGPATTAPGVKPGPGAKPTAPAATPDTKPGVRTQPSRTGSGESPPGGLPGQKQPQPGSKPQTQTPGVKPGPATTEPQQRTAPPATAQPQKQAPPAAVQQQQHQQQRQAPPAAQQQRQAPPAVQQQKQAPPAVQQQRQAPAVQQQRQAPPAVQQQQKPGQQQQQKPGQQQQQQQKKKPGEPGYQPS